MKFTLTQAAFLLTSLSISVSGMPALPVTQIDDGQIQVPPATPVDPPMLPISEIDDGQLQAPLPTKAPIGRRDDKDSWEHFSEIAEENSRHYDSNGVGHFERLYSTVTLVSTITIGTWLPGSVIASTSATPISTLVLHAERDDKSPHISTPTSKAQHKRALPVSWIEDGQPQAPPATPTDPPMLPVSAIVDGQLQVPLATTLSAMEAHHKRQNAGVRASIFSALF